MKLFRKICLILAGGTLLFSTSCLEDKIRTIDPVTGDKSGVNAWIYDMMNDAYFWYDQMPAKNKTDNALAPEEYFEKLVYQRQTRDRFSMLTDDINALQQQFNGITKTFGLHNVFAYIDGGKSNVAAFVSHVAKGSPADAAGLKRGDIITKVNGTQLTKDNYAQLIGGPETIRVNLGTVNGNVITTDDSRTISLTKAVVTEDPVAYAGVIPRKNVRLGYLVYTQFVPGTDSDKERYDNELREVFAGFKTAGVNELVLDLRLNGGGFMSSAVTLASLIVSNNSSGKVFYEEQWNDKYIKYWKEKNGANALTYKFKQEKDNIGSRLNRVFVLTSQGTASASELIINGLKPYMQVITIGDHTAGKNLFGSLVGDEKKRWNYGLYMMLGQTTNANGQSDYGTVNGIPASRQVEDFSIPYKPFGDETETLLNAAMREIGIAPAANARLGTAMNVKPVSSGAVRDTPGAWDQLMIRDLQPR